MGGPRLTALGGGLIFGGGLAPGLWLMLGGLIITLLGPRGMLPEDIADDSLRLRRACGWACVCVGSCDGNCVCSGICSGICMGTGACGGIWVLPKVGFDCPGGWYEMILWGNGAASVDLLATLLFLRSCILGYATGDRPVTECGDSNTGERLACSSTAGGVGPLEESS